jgi:hypothetical protein
MALAGSWQVAGALVLAERVGRRIRQPTVEAMLSYSTGKHGKGWVYAVNTAMDETGATLRPLLMALALFLKADFRTGYALLVIPSLFALASLAAARVVFPVPSQLEAGGPSTAQEKGFTTSYWLYMVAGACFAAGLMSSRSSRITYRTPGPSPNTGCRSSWHGNSRSCGHEPGSGQVIRQGRYCRRRRGRARDALFAAGVLRGLLARSGRTDALGDRLCDTGHLLKVLIASVLPRDGGISRSGCFILSTAVGGWRGV